MMPQTPQYEHCARPGGFTLIELVVTIAITSVIMLAMGSAILIATQALPDPERTPYRLNQSSRIAEQMLTELQEAQHIRERAAQAITFTVADRDANGSPERVRYAWSGTPGDPLTRQYNSGAEIAVLEDVNDFSLAYDVTTTIEQYPGPPVEGPEILLSSYTAGHTLKDYKVKSDDWMGQYFRPPGALVPAEAAYWRVTRVKCRAKEEGSTDEDSYVQLRPADAAHKPTTTVIEQQVMHEEDLTSSYVWQAFSFTGEHNLAPGGDLCLVIQGGGAGSANICYEDKDVYGATGRLRTGDSGNNWEYKTDKCVQHEIYGKVATATTQTATRQYVSGIRLTVQAGDDTAARIDTAVDLPNTPELLSAVWELDFETDPTTLDMNADASEDWQDDGTFDPASLVGGIWYVDSKLTTFPLNDFAELITAAVRFRTTSVGVGALFRINADWSGDSYAPIFATLERLADSTQTLKVYQRSASLPQATLATVSGLPDDFVDVGLIIDPDLDTVSVRVNNTHAGTFQYSTSAPGIALRRAVITLDSSDAEFDSVSIRVGGNSP